MDIGRPLRPVIKSALQAFVKLRRWNVTRLARDSFAAIKLLSVFLDAFYALVRA